MHWCLFTPLQMWWGIIGLLCTYSQAASLCSGQNFIVFSLVVFSSLLYCCCSVGLLLPRCIFKHRQVDTHIKVNSCCSGGDRWWLSTEAETAVSSVWNDMMLLGSLWINLLDVFFSRSGIKRGWKYPVFAAFVLLLQLLPARLCVRVILGDVSLPWWTSLNDLELSCSLQSHSVPTFTSQPLQRFLLFFLTLIFHVKLNWTPPNFSLQG